MSLTSRITRPSGPNEESFAGTPKLPGCAAYKRVPSLLVLTSWGRPSPVNVQLRSHLALYGSVTSIIGRMPPTPRNCWPMRSEEHTSELQSHSDLVCRLLLEK